MRPLWPFLLIYCISPSIGDDCAGTVELQATENAKFITTPNYAPNSTYPPFLDCTFVIKAPDKQRILIDIINLKMETKLFSSCVDYVAIYEDFPNNSNESSVLQFCEEEVNRQIISNSNQVIIQFKSDDLYQYAGANISFRSIGFHECPQGWTDMFNETCIKLSDPDEKLDWISAQRRCNEQKSNLILIETNDESSFIYNKYNLVPSHIWIGYHDGDEEGLVSAVDGIPREPNEKFKNPFKIIDNNDENDCVAIDYMNDIHYKLDKCSNAHMYICSMRKDWNTTLYPPSEEKLRVGYISKSSQTSFLFLLFIIGLLFLAMLLFLCFMCYKHNKTNRVHDHQSATVQHNAFMNNSQNATVSTPQPATSSPVPIVQQQQQVATVSGSMPNSSRVIEKVPMIRSAEKNRKQFPLAVGPKKVPNSEEPSGEINELETNIMTPGVSNEPEQLMPVTKPRTLPLMMPPREATFQSMNTRDGSTMRTRRNRELFDRPVMHVLDNVSAISLDEFWSNKKP